MNCERIQQSFIDLESNTLPDADAEIVRAHLKNCPTCQKEWADLQDTFLKLDRFPVDQPSPRLRTQFYAMLDTHLRDNRSSTSPFSSRSTRMDRWIQAIWPRRPVWQIATALLLLVGGVAAGIQVSMTAKSSQMASAQQLAATQKELAELRTRVDSVHQLVTYSLSQQQPAQARLQQVVESLRNGQPDERALAQLLSTLAFDPNTNVRLSALEALYAQAEKPGVRQGVLAALPRESSPLVQVAMIDFLASVRESAAVPTFQQIARQPLTDQAVRTAAQRAIAQL